MIKSLNLRDTATAVDQTTLEIKISETGNTKELEIGVALWKSDYIPVNVLWQIDRVLDLNENLTCRMHELLSS